MKRACQIAALLGALWMPLTAGASFQVDWVSRYVWRGFDLADNRSCVQPQVTFALGSSGFSVNLWANFCLEDRFLTKDFDEIDFTLIYAIPTGAAVSLEAGLICYAFYAAPGFTLKNNTSPEIYLKGGLPELPLAPTLTVYYDLNLGSGLYANLAVSQPLAIAPGVTLGLSAALGFNSRQYIAGSGFSDLSFGGALPLNLGRATLTPYLRYSLTLLESVNSRNEFWFGASLAF